MIRNFLHGIRAYITGATIAVAGRKIHSKMMFRVLHAKLGEFLLRVSNGQIINRFTKDIDKIDMNLQGLLSIFTL